MGGTEIVEVRRNDYLWAMITAKEILEILEAGRNETQARLLMRFFKTGKGEYGEGDRFLGLKVPQTRAVVKAARLEVPLAEIRNLLYSEWHEARLAGFLLLVEEMTAAVPRRRDSAVSIEGKSTRRDIIASFYLDNARQANNWDLVDLSCPLIIGEWLLHPSANGSFPDRDVLDRLASSENLWQQRISVVSTLRLIREGQLNDTLRISSKLLYHRHDLIHKAVGWMLREAGKKDRDVLTDFLDAHYAEMPRTALRYAIEKLPEPERLFWLRREIKPA